MIGIEWSLCEWDPVRNEPAVAVDVIARGCRNKATLRLGGNGDWHLCSNCAELPRFNKYTVRVPLDGS